MREGHDIIEHLKKLHRMIVKLNGSANYWLRIPQRSQVTVLRNSLPPEWAEKFQVLWELHNGEARNYQDLMSGLVRYWAHEQFKRTTKRRQCHMMTKILGQQSESAPNPMIQRMVEETIKSIQNQPRRRRGK